jgi:hypothetical protein
MTVLILEPRNYDDWGRWLSSSHLMLKFKYIIFEFVLNINEKRI